MAIGVCVCVCLGGGWSSLKMKLFCRIISMHFKVFSSVKVQNGTILLGGGNATKISNIFGVMPDISSRCWVQAYVARKK